MSLTIETVGKCLNGKPYKDDWPIQRGTWEETYHHYRELLNRFRNSQRMEYILADDGGMSNFISILCLPQKDHDWKNYLTTPEAKYPFVAINVLVSHYAPIAAFGETQGTFFVNGYGVSLLDEGSICKFSSPSLWEVVEEVLVILHDFNIEVIDEETALSPLPEELRDFESPYYDPKYYFHALFNVVD